MRQLLYDLPGVFPNVPKTVPKRKNKRLLAETVTPTDITPLFSSDRNFRINPLSGKLEHVSHRYSREIGTGSIVQVAKTIKGKPYKYFVGRLWQENEHGVRKRCETKYCKSKREAERELKKLRDVPASSLDAEKIYLETYLMDWLRTVKVQNKVATYDQYKSTVNTWLIPRIGKAKLGRLTAQHLKNFFVTLAEEGVSAATRWTVHKTLSKALEVAFRDGLMEKNPMRMIPKVKVTRRKPHILTDEETDRLLKAAEAEGCYELILTAMTTGMREAELFGLQWDDVHLEHRYIHVRQQLKKGHGGKLVLGDTKSAAGNRRIDLDPVTLAALQSLKERQARAGYAGQFVFTAPKKIKLDRWTTLRKSNFLRRQWARIKEAAKITDLHFHDLRHKANSELARAGFSLKVLQARLGDSTARTVMETYTHLLPGEQANAAAYIGQKFAVRGGN